MLTITVSFCVIAPVAAGPANTDESYNPALILLTEDAGRYDVSIDLLYLEDAHGTLSADEALAAVRSGRFQTGQTDTLNLGFTESAYWFYLRTTNRNPQQRDWILEIQYPIIDQIDMFHYSADGLRRHLQAGDAVPFRQRSRASHFTNFLIELDHGDYADILLRVETSGAIQMPTVVWNEHDYAAHYRDVQLLFGLYYGLIFSIAIYNFLLWLSLKDQNYLYCVAYITTYGLFQFTLNGLGFEYLWPDSPWWNNRSIAFLMSSGFFFIIAFSRSFLVLSVNAPRADIAFRFMMLFFVTMTVCALFLPYQYVIRTATLGSMLSAFGIFLTGIYCWLTNFKPARYFMLSWAALLTGMLVYTLKTFGFLPANFVTEYAMQIGSAMEVLLLSFALADRIKFITEENARIQRDAKTELEANVRARTQELQQANLKLEELSATDALTGLKNRRYFDEAFALECKRAARSQEHLSVLSLDIDHFKSINDTHGHQAGDHCLTKISEIMRGCVRRDTDTVARFGGEEFVIILPATNSPGALLVAEKIRQSVRRCQFQFGGQNLQVTLSIGIATRALPDTVDPNGILQHSDLALYQSKQNGRDRCTVYSEPQQPKAVSS